MLPPFALFVARAILNMICLNTAKHTVHIIHPVGIRIGAIVGADVVQ